ncbi:MAG: hypothetical protein RRY04_03065 [Oscillospiraceae bacterium]
MNRYVGASGWTENIPEPEVFVVEPIEETRSEEPFENRAEYRKPPGQPGILGGLGGISGIFSKIKKAVPETEDFILIGVLYLMYRESGDIEFLLIAGAMLFL